MLLFVSCNGSLKEDSNKNQNVLSLLKNLNSQNLSNIEKKEILEQAYLRTSKFQNDSLRNKALLQISYQYLKLEDSIAFKRTNKETRKLAVALQDSAVIAATYWDLGNYYQSENINDSAYYFFHRAEEIYNQIKNSYYSARMLLNMAIIQNDIKDYTGSEITTTKAISLLKSLKKYKHLYRAYNNLGIVFQELEDYDRALYYYEKASDYLEKAGRKDLLPSLWNNIGIVYNNRKEYDKAAEYYNKALNYDQNLINSDPELYAMLLDNRAYNQFQSGDTTGILPQFYKALGIRIKLNDVPGIIINKLHLAEYFLEEKDTAAAIAYASRAKKLAKKTQNSRDLLASLLVLSKAVPDSSLFYSQEYIRISDSLQQRERATRNKFARIRFETDEYISKTENLSEKITFISLAALGVILIFSLLYIIKHQRSRNKELNLIQQKQKANREILDLMLDRQKNFEEGREKEKKRISRELHDGILGDLSGVRMSLDALNEDDNVDIKKKRFRYIEKIGDITEEIRVLSHELNKSPIVDVGFDTLIGEFIKKEDQENIKIIPRINNSIDWDKIEDDIKINIYRIIQEAVHNIYKHSMATEIILSIRKINDLLILTIEDNGRGFVYNEDNIGIGLENMKSRAKNIHGKLDFFSRTSGKTGTTIRLCLRFPESPGNSHNKGLNV